jgi:hypothetical protein
MILFDFVRFSNAKLVLFVRFSKRKMKEFAKMAKKLLENLLVEKKVVPLHPQLSPDGGIGRRAGLKHQWSDPSRFDPGSGYAKRKRLSNTV